MSLRPYQETFKANIRTALAKHWRIIPCGATGSGKTKTFISIVNDSLHRGTTVLIITESTKIYKQIKAEQSNSIHIGDGIKFMDIVQGRCYIAMAQTLVRRKNMIEQFAALGRKLLIINDEAHLSTATKLLLQLPDAALLGFTATPDYRFAKHLPKLYNGIVVGPQPQELIELGFLAPYHHHELNAVDLKGLIKDSTGNFTEQSQYDVFNKQKISHDIINDLHKFHSNKTIIFCSSIKHCKALSAELREASFILSEVHSGNPNAEIELYQFEHGNIDYCVTVRMLTRGYDYPPIDLVLLVSAISSLPDYCQKVGRGARIFEGKYYFRVLDYGGNYTRHGLWNYEHDWAEMWNKPLKKKREGVAPVKSCPSCYLLVSTNVMLCPECGHKFEPAKKCETKVVEGTLIEVTEKYNQLRGKYIAELTAEELAQYAILTNKKAFAIRVAKAKQDELFLQSFANFMGYKNGWVKHQDISEPLEFFNIKIR